MVAMPPQVDRLLKGDQGYLMTDDYAGYNAIAKQPGIEKHHKAASPEERYQARQEQSLPILHKLKTWLDDNLLHTTSKNKLGVALGYLASNWSKLVRYTEAGYLPIDNNAAEGDIRHFAVGRKNWMFSDTPAGAHSSAIIYSLMQTAMANGKEPYFKFWRNVLMKQSKKSSEYTSTHLQPMKPATLSALEPLTRSEIDALRQKKKHISDYYQKVLASY